MGRRRRGAVPIVLGCDEKWLYNNLKMVVINVPTIDKRKRIPREAIDQVVEQIVEKFKPQKIILFGSYARGNPRPESDVDLLVVMDVPKGQEMETSLEIRRPLSLLTFGLDIVVRSRAVIERRKKLGDWFLIDITEMGKLLYERSHE